MAIYEGTYLDPNTGWPFDSNAFPRRLPCGPKSVQVRRRGRTRRAPINKNHVAAGKLAFAWCCRMSIDQQNAWKVPAARWALTRRVGEPPVFTSPFLAFAQVNWMRCYYGGYPMSLWPELPGPIITQWGIDWVSAAAQTATCFYTLPDDPLEYDQKELEWYQIDPFKWMTQPKYKFTRLIATTELRGQPTGPHQFDTRLRWKVPVGETVFFLLRQRDAYDYQQTYYVDKIAV